MNPSAGTLTREAPTIKVEVNGLGGLLQAVLRRREQLLLYIFEHERIGRILGRLFVVNLVFYLFYGVIMGIPGGLLQMAASGLKMPILYLLSLLVCFPVLYMVNVLMGSKLGFRQTLALLLVALALNAMLLASCAPIVVFFTMTGAKYYFLKLLHVVILGFGGLWAMTALYRGLVSMCEASSVYPRQAVRILLFWIVVFGFVGTQMAWSLRPFLGDPDQPFEIFRSNDQGNFYQDVWRSLHRL